MVENSSSKQDLLGSNLGRAHFSLSFFFLIFVIVVLFLCCIVYICLYNDVNATRAVIGRCP